MFYKQLKILAFNFWDLGLQNDFLPEEQEYAKVRTKLFLVISTTKQSSKNHHREFIRATERQSQE